jgi:hypothetical protein
MGNIETKPLKTRRCNQCQDTRPILTDQEYKFTECQTCKENKYISMPKYTRKQVSHMLEQANELCDLLHKTYNTNWLKEYPELEDIFVEVRDLYVKDPKKFPIVNETLLSLIYNLYNPEKLPKVDYITGPGEISKWESTKYNKVIYLFGENDHSNKSGCTEILLKGRTHMKIEKYLINTFKHSPVFIDFYVEFSVMLDELHSVSTSAGQTLWDMLARMRGCFGPLVDRYCPYNVRMHGVDARSIKSKKYPSSMMATMGLAMMMQKVLTKRGKSWMKADDFKKVFRKEIEIMSGVKNNADMIRITRKEILNNKLIMKELKRSTIDQEIILGFFVDYVLDNRLAKISNAVKHVHDWFKSLQKRTTYPPGLEVVSFIMIAVNAVIMDVYAVSRMFKVFNVKESEHYPKEAHNIIYYAGAGHTRPMGTFLNLLEFKRTEHSDSKLLSCANMQNIKQPLFSVSNAEPLL